MTCLHTLPFPSSSQASYNSPLQVAAGKGHKQIVESLLEKGANINYQDRVKSTCYTTDIDYIVQLMLAIHDT